MVLTAYDLWKSYGDATVVSGVNFTLEPGEVLGLLGANGAGKTTTVGMLYGAVIPTRGFVQIDKYEVRAEGRKARNLMGIVTQEDNLDPDFRVLENLMYFANFYRITGKDARNLAAKLLDRVGLQDYARHRIDELSGGLKRRLVLARALINQPKVVFLDEPTTGLDPDARQDFWRLVKDLKKSGCAVLLTTHYMDEAERLCDRLLVMQKGKAIDSGTPPELIDRAIGREVAEVEGIPERILEQLAAKYQTRHRSFATGYTLVLPPESADSLWSELSAFHPERLSRRRANLEDVFLHLTGSLLNEE